MIHRRLVLPSRLGEPIRGDLRFLPGEGKRPAVVVCHGLKGFKDWGFHPWLGERLAGAGFVAVHFKLASNRDRLDVRRAVSRLRCPYRIVHGTADEAVPFQEAESLLSYAGGRAGVELDPIEGAGHTFGAAHPFVGPTAALEQAFDATRSFLESHLAG